MNLTQEINFGAIKVPPGYRVVWSYVIEHYYAEKIDGSWESAMTCNRWDALRWAKEEAALQYARGRSDASKSEILD
jgi:hypothetical protein